MSQNKDTADEALARMGYQSELPRNLSMLSILGLYTRYSPDISKVANANTK